MEAEAEDGLDVLSMIREHELDLVLLDIAMPKKNGLEVLEEIKNLYPKLPVLILSIYSEEQYAVRALRAGAAGYLTKASVPHELISAIRKALQGGKYITLATGERLAIEVDGHVDKPRHRKLSNREYQVMLMLAAGQFVGEVAKELSLSSKTVSTYRERILEKMNMKKNAELTVYAIENDLLAGTAFGAGILVPARPGFLTVCDGSR